ncbi:MAG: hypothetical protein JSW34_00350 [Candidatus Zixiibacteriota bacterium]|nr:MAG: hypothetical protein JSW34_00350 [candidate division Zixibacteria bacterium]
MSDYESKAHNVYITASYVPAADLRLSATVAYNKAEASLQEVAMPGVEDRLEGELEDQDFTFEQMPLYSDLDFELINFTLGFEYVLSPQVTWTADGTFGTLWDYAPYVYDDETGAVFVVRSGLRIQL